MSRAIPISMIVVLAACGGADEGGGGAGPATATAELAPGAETISSDRLVEWTRTLSSDEFQGRGPSSPGEDKTVAYLRDEYQALGLQPGNGDSWYQEVPLVEITVRGAPTLTIRGSNAQLPLGWTDQYVAWTKRVVETSSLENSELVFVGYGIVAPEYGWNDYDGLDMAGKTAVILVNDPGFATQDSSVFRGNSMTYYGRWTYKFEEAARQGAAGAIIIHHEAPAGYPWEVVTGSWTGPQFDLVRDGGNMGRVAVEGWIEEDAATQVFEMAGQDLAALEAAAAQPGFRAVPLGIDASVTLNNNLRESTSRNVLAVLPGTTRADEYVVYMAHWDHFGTSTDPSLEDKIFNGAVDNATGTAALLELARTFASLPERPARSVLFLAVTAEEQGLLGSAYYATYPVYPTNKTAAAINIDGLNLDGPMNDITAVGFGNSELDDYLERAAAAEGRVVNPDPEPEKGFYYRSDHFSFAKVGVPALYTDAGIDQVEHGPEWTLERRADYTANRYHKPSDEFNEEWDWRGAVDDLRLLFDVGYRIADSADFPNWRDGNEFKAIRDADMSGM